MGFSLETSVPALTVFVQGLLSFFSPCVLPLIPLYVGYLAGGAGVEGDDGTIAYPRKKVLVNTLFFVVGVSFAFFLLAQLFCFFLQTCLLCPLFFLLALFLLCSLLRGDLLAVRLGSPLERRQGKYEKCDGSHSRCQPAPRDPAFWLLRFVPLRQRRKRKRRFFRNWFDFKRSWLLRHRLHRR